MRQTIQTEVDCAIAHRLTFHPKCSAVHGHNFKFIITITSDKFSIILIDFGQIKKITKDRYDHRLILKDCKENTDLINVTRKMNLPLLLLEEEPTAEALGKDLYKCLQTINELLYITIKVYENERSWAEYHN